MGKTDKEEISFLGVYHVNFIVLMNLACQARKEEPCNNNMSKKKKKKKNLSRKN